MITNFESYTYNLTERELMEVEPIISVLKTLKKEHILKSYELVYLIKVKTDIEVNQRRLRKIVNYIRANALCPVISTQRGYYVSYDVEEISKQIKSHQERMNSCMDCIRGLSIILKQIK